MSKRAKPHQTAPPKKRGSYKSPSLKDKAAQLKICGLSNRAVARELGVRRQTIPSMLEDSEFWNTYRRKLRDRVPKALGRMDKALKNKDDFLGFKAAAWVLEHTQVGVPKSEQAATTELILNAQYISDRDLDGAIAERCRRLGIGRLITKS